MISAKTKYKLKSVLFIIGWWIFVTVFYVIIRGKDASVESLPDSETLSLVTTFVFSILGGILIGVIMGFFEVFMYPKWIKNKPFSYSVLFKTSVFGLLIFGVTIILGLIYGKGTGIEFRQTLLNVMDYFWSRSFLSMVSYLLVCSILISFIMQMNQKFGPGMLWKLVRGSYYHPKEENRVFMFLDLHDSTFIAESLGHIQFSYFLQDCFNDLSEVLLDFEASVYQYVRDEAVLTWSNKEGIRNANCIKIYFAFEVFLKKKKHYYLQRYGFLPFFKASINMGIVTVAEVGEIKSEIAYHGDVLNTAARVQGLCNIFNEKLLVTEVVSQAFEEHPEVQTYLKDKVSLRGKNNQVNIYSATFADAQLVSA